MNMVKRSIVFFALLPLVACNVAVGDPGTVASPVVESAPSRDATPWCEPPNFAAPSCLDVTDSHGARRVCPQPDGTEWEWFAVDPDVFTHYVPEPGTHIEVKDWCIITTAHGVVWADSNPTLEISNAPGE